MPTITHDPTRHRRESVYTCAEIEELIWRDCEARGYRVRPEEFAYTFTEGRLVGVEVRVPDTDGEGAPDKWEVRECATLGTLFRDIYRNEELFAMQVPVAEAEEFIANRWKFGNTLAPEAMLRARALHVERALWRERGDV